MGTLRTNLDRPVCYPDYALARGHYKVTAPLPTSASYANARLWAKVQLMTLGACKKLVGGLSSPGKMPCYGYGLPAKECITGSKLRAIAGSVCGVCYALKGRYIFKNVQDAQYRRYGLVDAEIWPYAMARLISHYSAKSKVFRWHDSGDLKSYAHLEAIALVANLTPDIMHWLPTKEVQMIAKFRAQYGPDYAPNLNPRLSGFMMGGVIPTFRNIPNVTVSVAGAKDYPGVYNCPSRYQNNSCGDCRACWNKDVKVVAYHAH
jgi:Gene product 88